MRVTRRVRSWRNRTPSQEIALAFMGFGAVLVLLAAVFLGLRTNFI